MIASTCNVSGSIIMLCCARSLWQKTNSSVLEVRAGQHGRLSLLVMRTGGITTPFKLPVLFDRNPARWGRTIVVWSSWHSPMLRPCSLLFRLMKLHPPGQQLAGKNHQSSWSSLPLGGDVYVGSNIFESSIFVFKAGCWPWHSDDLAFLVGHAFVGEKLSFGKGVHNCKIGLQCSKNNRCSFSALFPEVGWIMMGAYPFMSGHCFLQAYVVLVQPNIRGLFAI